MTRKRFIEILRTCIPSIVVAAAAIVLIYTGSAKLLAPSTFAQTIASHGLIPEVLTPHVAWGVIALELLVGVSSLWLLTGRRLTRHAAMGAAAVFAAFAWYAGAMVVFPPPAPTSCGCAGSAQEPANWRALTARNAGAAGLLVIMLPVSGETKSRR